MSKSRHQETSFADLNLPVPLLKALESVGYENASPIQTQAIPHLLKGSDLLGHAPTGTGKTAAFALPLLARLDSKQTQVQVLTLTPTRELAIQVAEAFKRYASHMKSFQVVPIYGGQEYGGQIRALKRGVQVVVGTPGRVMDHMRKGTLKLDKLKALVLDEADEMLRMGFIDEVEWILQQTPDTRQMALFSATMPKQIETIARRYLTNPQKVSIKSRTETAETIHQRYWLVSGLHKLDALTRILEVETYDAVLLFVRTRNATTELAEKLEARGYAAAAMNGDMAQKHREQMIQRLKNGSLDLLVATDVAARGLDVDRISHVINYDIPYDTEAYIHRIGRTGRAGRKGNAILFVAPRERRMLAAIERATRKKIDPLQLPSTEAVKNQRIAKFKQKITDTLATGELGFMQNVIDQYQQEHDVPASEIAAALAQMAFGTQPSLAVEKPERASRSSRDPRKANDSRAPSRKRQDSSRPSDPTLDTYRLEVGLQHNVEASNIVGAIANEAGVDAAHIGLIDIRADHTTVELPQGMPKDVFADLRKVWVCGRQLKISKVDSSSRSDKKTPRQPSKRKSNAKQTLKKKPGKQKSSKSKGTKSKSP
ncbi:MAG: DEAD/DEAH box helicase [Gammaproteobacteria bacterium]|nr:DEAD/DEAH box helicase [Gammaproteobacteria bacterium]